MLVVDLTLADIPPDDPRMNTDVSPLIRVLRPTLTARAFAGFADEAYRQGLRFTVAYDATGRSVGVATHRLLATSRGKVLFVGDLATAPALRGRGVGALLLAELERRGRGAGCTRMELDSGTANVHAHRFYHARRMTISALHFGLDLGPDGPSAGHPTPGGSPAIGLTAQDEASGSPAAGQ